MVHFSKVFFKVYEGEGGVGGLCPCGGTMKLLVTSLISFLQIPVSTNAKCIFPNTCKLFLPMQSVFFQMPVTYFYQCKVHYFTNTFSKVYSLKCIPGSVLVAAL